MDAEHVYNLRNEYGDDNPGFALVLYLDLPPERAEDWQMQRHTVMALSRRLSEVVAASIEAAGEDDLAGLNDEAVRSIRLLLGFTVAEQEALATMLEGLQETFARLVRTSQTPPESSKVSPADEPGGDGLEGAVEAASNLLQFPRRDSE